MKMKTEIKNYLADNFERFKLEYRVSKIGLFGSALKSDIYNDIDVVVDMKDPDLDSYMDLKFELEEKFNSPVDLVLLSNVKKRLLPIISKEAEFV